MVPSSGERRKLAKFEQIFWSQPGRKCRHRTEYDRNITETGPRTRHTGYGEKREEEDISSPESVYGLDPSQKETEPTCGWASGSGLGMKNGYRTEFWHECSKGL